MFQRASLHVQHRVQNYTKRFKHAYKIVRIKPLQGSNAETSEINEDNQEEALRYAIAPLWNIPYVEQLEMKNDYITYVVSQYFSIMKEHFSNPSSNRTFIPPRRPSIKHISPSPALHQYRTKDVYMVRAGINGNPKTVGHIVGRPSVGKYVCVPPVDLLSPSRHVQVAKAFQDYIRTSTLPACLNFSEGGNWTQIQVRSNSEGETMALVKIHPQQLTQGQMEDECGKLKEFFETGPGSVCELSSLYFQSSPFSNASGKLAPYILLSGNKHLMEKLSGRDFALSPGSFFQSNRKMAEIMYEKIFTAAKLSQGTSILDLGCGIGTISILVSPFVRDTVGIDMSEEAIEDAKLNSRLNNIHSINFLGGKMEQKLKTALNLIQHSSDVVAILNPGRCGVDVSVIRALRDTPQIGKVIYVACQPDHEWVIRNVLALIKPKGPRVKSSPFTLDSVIPVDMFPQTAQVEVVFKFVR